MPNSELMENLEQMVDDVDRFDFQKKSEQIIRSLEIERNHEFMNKFFKIYSELCKAHQQLIIDEKQFKEGVEKLDISAEKMFGHKFSKIKDHYYPNESTPIPELSEYSRKGVGDQTYSGDVNTISVLPNGHMVSEAENNTAGSSLEISGENIRFLQMTVPKQAVIRTVGEDVYCNSDRTGIYQMALNKNKYRDQKRVVQGEVSNFKVYPDGIVVSHADELRIYRHGDNLKHDLLQGGTYDFAMQIDGSVICSEDGYIYRSKLKEGSDSEQEDEAIFNFYVLDYVSIISPLPNGDLLIVISEANDYKLIKLNQNKDGSYSRGDEYTGANNIINIQPLMNGRILAQTEYDLKILNPNLTVRETIEPALTTNQNEFMRDFSIDSYGTIYIAQGRKVLLYEGLNNE